jgi:putative ABC transport system permease protein
VRHQLRADEEDDFNVRSQTEMLQTMSAVTGTLTALLGAVALVSLLVGGIGIMNIMLASVRERTREIGVRMAVGARRRDILLQFLAEAVVVSVAGGIAGLALGCAGAAAVAELAGWSVVIPAYGIALALGVSFVVGIVFGVGPARSAARLDPVEALRHE